MCALFHFSFIRFIFLLFFCSFRNGMAEGFFTLVFFRAVCEWYDFCFTSSATLSRVLKNSVYRVKHILYPTQMKRVRERKKGKNDINVHRNNSSNATHSINAWPVFHIHRYGATTTHRHICVLLCAFPTPPSSPPPLSLSSSSSSSHRECLMLSAHTKSTVYFYEVVTIRRIERV